MFSRLIVRTGNVDADRLQSVKILEDIGNYRNKFCELNDFIELLSYIGDEKSKNHFINSFKILKDISFKMDENFYYNKVTFKPVSNDSKGIETMPKDDIIFEKVYLIWEDKLKGIMTYDYKSRMFELEGLDELEGNEIRIRFDKFEKPDLIYYCIDNRPDQHKRISLEKLEYGELLLTKFNRFSDKPRKIVFNMDGKVNDLDLKNVDEILKYNNPGFLAQLTQKVRNKYEDKSKLKARRDL